MQSIIALTLLLNVLYVDHGVVHVGEVVKRSGFEIDVIPCEAHGDTFKKKRIRITEASPVEMSCYEYLRTIQ